MMLQIIEPITEFLPNRIRSFVNISEATVADSGKHSLSENKSVVPFLLAPDQVTAPLGCS